MKQPAIYFITNYHNTTLYVGVTSKLQQRIYQHRTKKVKGFSCKYNLEKLVYFELFETMKEAILREKRLKNWQRAWKDRLICELNPFWEDLYLSL
ncbi:GIY-YIG nuclease family protein [Glaciecola sp. 2405UD65-10]|uniref:GIY-YIG nuclease family protein n=1 Tax=Glaciecola sp. 2405UD65-10 TaxID=3397244 RepID=UPI003B5C83F9